MAQPFNPYPYQPIMRYYYEGGALPQDIQKAADADPQAAAHLVSVYQFSQWMARWFPQQYALVNSRKPSLLDAGSAVASGALRPVRGQGPVPRNVARGKPGLSGLGEYDDTGILNQLITQGPQNVQQPYFGADWSGTVTEWGRSILDIIKAKQVNDYQKRILEENIRRAEKGLPPLNMDGLAPQVNVGLSPGVLQLGYIAVGGLILAGVASAFKASGKGRR